MRKHLRIWVMVVDGAHAQLFVPDEDLTGLQPATLPGLPAVETHGHARDLTSDRPGRSFSSAGGGTRHAIEPRHDYHKQEKHNLAAAVAKEIERAFVAREFDRLVLVSPPRTVGEMRTLLPDRIQAEMQVVAKDLTKATAPELWREVTGIVPRLWLVQAG